jgi:hypothetical protein
MMDLQPVDPEAVAPVATDARGDVRDVQLLGMIAYLLLEEILVANGLSSTDGLQTGTSSAVFHPAGFRNRFQHHGPSAFNRIDPLLLSPHGSGRHGLGRG